MWARGRELECWRAQCWEVKNLEVWWLRAIQCVEWMARSVQRGHAKGVREEKVLLPVFSVPFKLVNIFDFHSGYCCCRLSMRWVWGGRGEGILTGIQAWCVFQMVAWHSAHGELASSADSRAHVGRIPTVVVKQGILKATCGSFQWHLILTFINRAMPWVQEDKKSNSIYLPYILCVGGRG